MGTANHRHHHNSCPTGIRTQNITAHKTLAAALEAASQLFCKREEVYLFERFKLTRQNRFSLKQRLIVGAR
jgi:hypothetical protein